MEKSVLNQICTLYDSFFETEKKIAIILSGNPKDSGCDRLRTGS